MEATKMKQVIIDIPVGKKIKWAYGTLTLVDETHMDAIYRILTVQDAIKVLNDSDGYEPNLEEYKLMVCDGSLPDSVRAMYKLRIICAAMNCIIETKFPNNIEGKVIPNFIMRTQNYANSLTEEEFENEPMISTDSYNADFPYFAFRDCTLCDLDYMPITPFGIYFLNEDAAKYCAEEFINLWADMMLMPK